MSETKADKFSRLYPKRLDNALDALRVLGNLSAKNNYEWTDEQAREILSSLRESIDVLAAKFDHDSPSPLVEADFVEMERKVVAPTVVARDEGRLIGVYPHPRDVAIGRAMEQLMDGQPSEALATLAEYMGS